MPEQKFEFVVVWESLSGNLAVHCPNQEDVSDLVTTITSAGGTYSVDKCVDCQCDVVIV